MLEQRQVNVPARDDSDNNFLHCRSPMLLYTLHLLQKPGLLDIRYLIGS